MILDSKALLLSGGLLILAAVSSGGATAQGTAAGGDDGMVEWLDDYAQALAEARRTGKPIFLEFRCAP